MERHAHPGAPAEGRRRSRTSPATAPTAATSPCRCFGVAPISGVGDDTITNFTVPTFYYGGEPYTRIGVVSNGYVVVGGGTAADVVFTPQTFPNPARPNNVLAPFWTDLNPAAGGAIRIATLTGDRPDADQVARRRLRGGEELQQRDDAHVRDLDQARRRGPRHRPGERGDHDLVRPEHHLPGDGRARQRRQRRSGLRRSTGAPRTATARAGRTSRPLRRTAAECAVDTSPPTAGGSATITYDASSKKAGTYKSVAGMTSNVTPGTTQVVKTLTVTP